MFEKFILPFRTFIHEARLEYENVQTIPLNDDAFIQVWMRPDDTVTVSVEYDFGRDDTQTILYMHFNKQDGGWYCFDCDYLKTKDVENIFMEYGIDPRYLHPGEIDIYNIFSIDGIADEIDSCMNGYSASSIHESYRSSELRDFIKK